MLRVLSIVLRFSAVEVHIGSISLSRYRKVGHIHWARILFYSDGKRAMAAANDNPSGSDKGQIHQNIAKLLFASHPKYGAAYTINPKKFRSAVGNCIGMYVSFFLGSVDQITKFLQSQGQI
jgi:hypothetical protein